MKFLVTFLIICLFPQTILGGSRAVCPTQPIKVVEGENVALHCGLDHLVDLSRYTVDWSRVDNQQVVYVYRHGRDDLDPVVDQYRGRTTINHEALSRGNITLKISSANLSDSGSYKCFVPKLKVWCEVQLIVDEKETKTDVSSTTVPPLEEEPESEDHGGNREAGRAAVISTVVFLLCSLVVFLVLRSRAMRQKEPKQNGCHLESNTYRAERDGDQEEPAATGLLNV
ncbi:myelin-oligodendrocyte glycoprotein-like isoform X1 [Anarrhichthys ocellatus]|uniref:myelin-oligodendrocyte glycoprotein-like isoform X1 n=1 Tax=Anarrhichthys ocellatus TaxID=433405 RepID=UPI0012EE0857|nr:myelin-oligodendrocyte glycoprotein-like isoform X1 [Anarrhichthys ocellatus]